MAKRGRPAGATSWTGNPVNVAAHHASILMEYWLARAPELAVRGVLGLLAWDAEAQLLIEDCWRNTGDERRFTVPKPIKRKICKLAVAHVIELHRQTQDATPQIEVSMQRAKSAAEAELRSRGMSDVEIASWFKTLAERARKRSSGAGLTFRRGDRIRVRGGPLTGRVGIFEGMRSHERVAVLLSMLGAPQRVELPAHHVEAVDDQDEHDQVR